jgi:hypothetical protein
MLFCPQFSVSSKLLLQLPPFNTSESAQRRKKRKEKEEKNPIDDSWKSFHLSSLHEEGGLYFFLN